MKRIFSIIILLVVLAGCGNGKSESKKSENNLSNQNKIVGIEEGNIAPDVELYNLKKEKKTLKDYRGKIVLLNFWATWCPPCREEMPSIQKFYDKNKSVEIIAVSVDQDPMETVNEFITANGYTFPIFYDLNQTLSNKFFVRSIPTTYIIDREGVIIKKIIGGFNWEEMKMEEISK